MISIKTEVRFPKTGMSVSSVRNGGSVLPEYWLYGPELWLSKSGLVAQTPPEYSGGNLMRHCICEWIFEVTNGKKFIVGYNV